MNRVPISLLFGLSLLTLNACFVGPGFFSQDDDSSSTPREDVQLITDENGVVIGVFSATSNSVQVLNGSSGNISGAQLAIPPGALFADVNITMEEGVGIADASTLAELGVGGDFSEASSAINISASEDIDASSPMELAVPLNDDATLALLEDATTRLIIIYKVKIAETGEKKIGIFPRRRIKLKDGKAFFKTRFFGSYQAAYSSELIEELVEKSTDSDIVTIRQQEAAANETAAVAKLKVTSANPTDGETGVALGKNIKVYFNGQVNTTTVGNSTMSLIEQNTGDSYTGSLGWNSTQKTMTLNPHTRLRMKADYKLTLDSSIKGTSLAALGSDQSMIFTTRDGSWESPNSLVASVSNYNFSRIKVNSDASYSVVVARTGTDDLYGYYFADGSWTAIGALGDTGNTSTMTEFEIVLSESGVWYAVWIEDNAPDRKVMFSSCNGNDCTTASSAVTLYDPSTNPTSVSYLQAVMGHDDNVHVAFQADGKVLSDRVNGTTLLDSDATTAESTLATSTSICAVGMRSNSEKTITVWLQGASCNASAPKYSQYASGSWGTAVSLDNTGATLDDVDSHLGMALDETNHLSTIYYAQYDTTDYAIAVHQADLSDDSVVGSRLDVQSTDWVPGYAKLAADSSGNLIVAFDNSSDNLTTAYYRNSDNSFPASGDATVSTTLTSLDVVANKEGRGAVVWENANTNIQGIVYDGGVPGSASTIASESMTTGYLVGDVIGNISFVYHAGSLKASRYTHGGSSWSTSTTLSSGSYTASDNVSSKTVQMNELGQIIVFWSQDTGTDELFTEVFW